MARDSSLSLQLTRLGCRRRIILRFRMIHPLHGCTLSTNGGANLTRIEGIGAPNRVTIPVPNWIWIQVQDAPNFVATCIRANRRHDRPYLFYEHCSDLIPGAAPHTSIMRISTPVSHISHTLRAYSITLTGFYQPTHQLPPRAGLLTFFFAIPGNWREESENATTFSFGMGSFYS